MPCFSILISYPQESTSPVMKALNEKRLQVLLKSRTLQHFQKKDEESLVYHVALCDYDAIRFLISLPVPLFVKEIRYLYDPHSILFSNRWLLSANEATRTPRSPIEKDVFWAAKATERWTPKYKIES